MSTLAVVDGRTEVDQFDADTNISSYGGEALNIVTGDPVDPVEDSGCIGMSIGEETGDAIATITLVNLSAATLVYVWVLANGSMEDIAGTGLNLAPGIQMVLGDGTDAIGYGLAGSDATGFRHEVGPVGWQCLCMDTTNLADAFTEQHNGAGSPSLAALTEFGGAFSTVSKALGGTINCFVDIVRYGNQGLVITLGTTGTPGFTLEIADFDRDPTNTRAFGIIRELANNNFESQGAIAWGGIGTDTTVTIFRDQDGSINWRELTGGIATGIYKLVITEGTGSGHETEFKLGLLVGSGDTRSGANGFSLIGTVLTPWEFDASDVDVQRVLLYGGTMSWATDGVTFSDDATNAANHDIAGWTFANCAQILLNRVPCRATVFSAYAGVNAALLWNANIDIKNCNFNGNTDGTNDPAGIEHTVAGSFSYSGMGFSGNDFDILNSATAVTEDTYSESNQDGVNSIGDTVDAVGQTFVGANGISSSCWFFLKKTGSPTGNAVAKIYSVTGTPGSGATPNTLLATSAVVDVSALTGSYVLTKFEFPGAINQITLVTSTDYFIVIEYTGGSGGNVVDVGVDTSSVPALQNLATFDGSWTADNTRSACYYVSTGGIVIINATDSNPSTSRNTGAVEGIVDIRSAVDIIFNVEDEAKDPIQNAQTSVYLLDDPTIELMNEDTNAGGIATEGYNFAGEVDIKWRVRKSETTDNPRYEARSGTGTITSSGFTLTVTMKENTKI